MSKKMDEIERELLRRSKFLNEKGRVTKVVYIPCLIEKSNEGLIGCVEYPSGSKLVEIEYGEV